MDENVSAEALRESEELHRITLLNMSDAVFITNDQGVFTYICPNVDVIFGYSHDEVRRMGRIAGLLGTELVDRDRLAVGGEIRNIEHEVDTKGGARRSLLVHVKPVSIKGGTALYVCRDVTDRRVSQERLRQNEARLSLALEAASMGTWDWQVPSGEMTWSPETHRILGDPEATLTPSFETLLDLLHPADRQRVATVMSDAVAEAGSYETDFRVVGLDEVERWVMGKGRAVRGGGPLRMLGVFVDFTDRHRMEEQLRELSGRLIHAHEQERKRISREIHDDLAQRLSLLALDLSMLPRRYAPMTDGLRERIGELSEHVSSIGADLHRVSHELHPATLGQLGLEAAIRTFCDELSQTGRLAVHLEVRDLPHPLPPDVALCVYRIAQEALHNVVRHSGATAAAVTLEGAPDELRLSVADTGRGFDPQEPRDSASLGLRSMRERVRLVNGQLFVRAKKGEGTTIEVRVPLRHGRRG